MSAKAHSDELLRKKTDDILLSDAQNGDIFAFEQLWSRYERPVRVSIQQLARHNSCDVMRETHDRLRSELAAGAGPESHFAEYTTSVARAIAAKWYRGPNKTRVLNVFPVNEETRAYVSGCVPTGREVATAFAMLPVETQSLLWLSEIDHRAPADIAKELGVSRFTLGSRHRKAEKQLHQTWLLQHLPPAATHPATVSMFPAYLGASLSKVQRQDVDAHLDACESCASVLWDLKITGRTLDRVVLSALILTGPGSAASTLKVASVPAITETTSIVGAPEVLGSVASFGTIGGVGAGVAAATVAAPAAAASSLSTKTGMAAVFAGKTMPNVIAGFSGAVLLAVGTAFTASHVLAPTAPPTIATAAEADEPAEPVSFDEPTDESIPKSANGSDTVTTHGTNYYEVMPGTQVVLQSGDVPGVSIPIEVSDNIADAEVQERPETGDDSDGAPGALPGDNGNTGDDEDADSATVRAVHAQARYVNWRGSSAIVVWGTAKKAGEVTVTATANDTEVTAKQRTIRGDWRYRAGVPVSKKDVPTEVTLEFADADGELLRSETVAVKNTPPTKPDIPSITWPSAATPNDDASHETPAEAGESAESSESEGSSETAQSPEVAGSPEAETEAATTDDAAATGEATE